MAINESTLGKAESFNQFSSLANLNANICPLMQVTLRSHRHASRLSQAEEKGGGCGGMLH